MTRVIEQPEKEIERTDFSGTIWFGATLVSASIVLAGLVMSGWRPADLGSGAVVWWVGSALAAAGIFLLAYAGCPVEGPNVQFDDRTKTLAIRAGLLLFLLGGVVALVDVLLN